MTIITGGSLLLSVKQQLAIIMSTAAKTPTIYTHYRVNGEKVSEKTYKLVRATLQMELFTPYQEHKQRIPLSKYSIHTIFEITF